MNQDLTVWLLAHYGREVMRPGLERMTEALRPILEPLRKISVITIAGTNGKGETTLRLSQELKNSSHLVWTSPHIERITERFRTEKGEIEIEELRSLIQSCHQDILDRKISLSYYEFLFFVFCTWAVKINPEYLLLEVGLGGRLDAVNVLDAKMVLIPSISRDHQEILGNRYDLILKEKLGVVRSGSVVLSSMSLKYLQERSPSGTIHLDVVKPWDLNDFSGRNELLAHAASLLLLNSSHSVSELKVKLQNWTPSRLPLEHRGEVIGDTNKFILFGSHNTDGLRKLIQFLHSGNYTFPRPPYDLIVLGFSKRDTQDLQSMLRMMKQSHLGKIVVTSFEHPKALGRDEAREISLREGFKFVFDIEELVQEKINQNVLVTGSYYFLADFKHRLRRLSEASARG